MSSIIEIVNQNDWKYLPVSEFADVITGGTPKTNIKEYWEDGNIPWLPSGNLNFNKIDSAHKFITDLGLKKSSAKLMPINTVVIAMTGATLGRIGVLGIEASANQSVTGILPNDSTIPKFLFYFLWSSYYKIISEAGGSAQPGINQKYVKNLQIPIPPLEVQKHIVAKIDTLFAKIDKAISLTEESLVQAKNLLPSVLGEVFRGLSINNNLVELSDLCDFKNGFAFKSKDFNKVGNGVQVLRIGNVLDVSKNPVYIEKKEAYKGYMLCKNDIVVSMTGTRLKKDYLFVRVIKNEPFYLNQRVGKISSRSFTYYRYIYFYLKSDMFRSEVFKYETGAVNQGNISGKAIMKMLIPKVDIDTQKEIANKCLDVSNQSKQTHSKLEEQLAYLKQLKSSILSKAFKGEL